MSKPRITNRDMCSLAKAHLGYGARKNVSIWTLMSFILRKNGIFRPPNISDKAFVNSNASYLKTLSKKKKGNDVAVEKAVFTEAETATVPRKARKITHSKEVRQALATIEKKRCHSLLGKPEYNDFYRSLEWQELRYLVLRDTERCDLCGAKDGVQLHVDHIKPRSRYPELELDLNNLQVLCEDCNKGKGDWDDSDFRDTEQPTVTGWQLGWKTSSSLILLSFCNHQKPPNRTP